MRLQSLACALGMHHRDPASSRAEEGRYIGECAGCGRPMVWKMSGWQLDRRAPHLRGSQPGIADGK